MTGLDLRRAFRDPDAARRLADRIAASVTRPWSIMEVCGGQTHAILRHGIDQLLPPEVTLLHGPGCPVCVTPEEAMVKAVAIARTPGAVLATFADMLRVPAGGTDLAQARAAGAEVRAVASPLDAVDLAEAMPDRQVVFFAVGFETTAPAVALAAHRAKARGLANFSLLVCHVMVPPALEALLASPDCRIDGFLAAGHVCTVMGTAEYAPISERHHVPIVVTGFEPIDILQGVAMCVDQLEAGRAEVENQYARAVRADGNPAARALMAEVFEVVPRRWRGLGTIPASGLGLSAAYRGLDAEARFGAVVDGPEADSPCIAGAVLRGEAKPTDCPAFGRACTPERPMGVTMVSAEGACAAYHRYGRAQPQAATARETLSRGERGGTRDRKVVGG
ncbi:MAG: hydrogenase formation protein HypD [Azospirillaceae bacterium]